MAMVKNVTIAKPRWRGSTDPCDDVKRHIRSDDCYYWDSIYTIGASELCVFALAVMVLCGYQEAKQPTTSLCNTSLQRNPAISPRYLIRKYKGPVKLIS